MGLMRGERSSYGKTVRGASYRSRAICDVCACVSGGECLQHRAMVRVLTFLAGEKRKGTSTNTEEESGTKGRIYIYVYTCMCILPQRERVVLIMCYLAVDFMRNEGLPWQSNFKGGLDET